MTTVVLNTTTRKVEVFSSARDVQARAYGHDSRAALEAATVPAGIPLLFLRGYAVAGDGGAAHYKRVASEPAHAGKIQSADGAWWKIAETALNVLMFGAKGDGTTNDVTACENAIVALAALGGGTLRFPAGTYLLQEGTLATPAGLYINSDNIHLKGDGPGRTTIKSADAQNIHIIQIAGGTENITIEGMSIDGNRVNQAAEPEVHGILFQGSINLRLLDLEIHDTVGYGIGGQNGANQKVFVDRLWGHDTGANVIDIKNKDNGNDSTVISNVVAENWGLTGTGARGGITVRGRAVINNIFCRNYGGAGTSAIAGVRVQGGDDLALHGLGGHYSTISNVIVEGNSKDGNIGVQILGSNCAVSAITVSGVETGIAVYQPGNTFSAIHTQDCDIGFNFTLAGGDESTHNTLSGFVARDCVTGLRVRTAHNTIVGYNISTCTTGILVVAGAEDTVIGTGHFDGNTTDISDNGTNTAYEAEGTFTPTFTFITPGDLSVSYSVQSGYWWRKGRRVWFDYTIKFTPTYTSATGIAFFDGLPFATRSVSGIAYSLSLGEMDRVVFQSGDLNLVPQIGTNSTRFSFRRVRSGLLASSATTDHFPSGNEYEIVVSGSYLV